MSVTTELAMESYPYKCVGIRQNVTYSIVGNCPQPDQWVFEFEATFTDPKRLMCPSTFKMRSEDPSQFELGGLYRITSTLTED